MAGSDEKILRYLGLAKRGRMLISGINTCTYAMSRGKVSLVILAEDISENSEKKILKEIRKNHTDFIRYGKKSDLSHAVGQEERSVFAITDDQFAKTILKEIMREIDRRRVCE